MRDVELEDMTEQDIYEHYPQIKALLEGLRDASKPLDLEQEAAPSPRPIGQRGA